MKTLKQLLEAKDDGSYLSDFTQKTEVGKTFVQLHKEMNATREKLAKDHLQSNTTSVPTTTFDRAAHHMGYNPGDDLTKAFPKMAGPDDYRLNTTYDAYRLQDEETINEDEADELRRAWVHHGNRAVDHRLAAEHTSDPEAKTFHNKAEELHDQLFNHYRTAHKNQCKYSTHIPHPIVSAHEGTTVPGHEGTTSESSTETSPVGEGLMSFKELTESVTRKHFQETANTVRAIEDPKKRQEFADHHAAIYSKQDPRFDHARFHQACGTAYRVHESLEEANEYKDRMSAYQKDSKFLMKPQGDNFAMVGHDTGYVYHVDKDKNRIKNFTEDHNALKKPPSKEKK